MRPSSILTRRQGVYVLNLLRAQKYQKGSVQYGSVPFGGGSGSETDIDAGWFEPKVDYLFETPPRSVVVSSKRGQRITSATRTDLYRRLTPRTGSSR